MKESIKEGTGNQGAGAKANIKLYGYGSVQDWQYINVTNQAPTITGPQGDKKVVDYGSTLTESELKKFVTVHDTEDDKDLTRGTKVHVDVVSVNGNSQTKSITSQTPGSYTVKYKAVDSQGKESGEKTVTVEVKPQKPTVTPQANGDVTISNVNQTNVNRLEVTYTPNPTRRLQDNGNVAETEQARTTVVATKGTNNQWTITQGQKDGISISNTGELTLKDYVVKDLTSVEAKVLAQNIASNVETQNAKAGEKAGPDIVANSTLIGVGKQLNIPLKISDGAGVGVDEGNIRVTNLPSGLTYDSAKKTITGTLGSAAKYDITVRALDKNGNKTEKIISIVAIQPKPIYAIKGGTINNVGTPSNFVEIPTGVTSPNVAWKNGQPSTATAVENTSKTVTVTATGYTAADVDVPVTVYPTVTLRKVGGNEVDTYHEIVGQPLTSRLVSGGGSFKDVTPDYYIAFEGGRKPDGTRVEFEGGTPPERSTTAGVTHKTIKVTYPNGAGSVTKEITFKTYGNEANYETGKDSIETIVGTEFSKLTARNSVKLSDPNLPNPDRTFIGWYRNGDYTPENKIGKRNENVNVWYGYTVKDARGDGTNNYNDQNIPVNVTVKPQAPTIATDAFHGKGATRPAVTVSNIPTSNQLEENARVTVELYQGGNKVASKELSRDEVTRGAGSVRFDTTNYTSNLILGEKVHAVVKVEGGSGTTAYNLSSANSNDVQVTPQKPTFDTTAVTSTSRTLSGTLGGFNDTNRVVELHLNDEANTVLSSARNEVTLTGDKWTANIPEGVKLRASVAKNGETTTPPAITVKNTVTGGAVSTTSDAKEVSMGSYSVSPAIAGSKHIDITVPHDAKRVELRFHNNQEKGDKPNGITLVRGADGIWHTEATRADNTTVTDASGYVGRISSSASKTNPAESIITIPLNEENNGKKLHIREEAANGDNTAIYGKGLGLRVEYQPEAGQDPTAAGNWKVASVTNTAPTIKVKGDTGKDATHRKVYDSGTTLTADVLKDLVTVTDAEDSVTPDENKPFGTGNVKIISQIPAANGTGTTPAGLYEVTLAAVDSQGKEGSQVKVYVAVKEATPSAPAVGQWQNGNVKVTPNSTNSGDKITIPLKSGSVVVTKDAQNGWQVTGQPNGVSVHDGSIEIPRNLVNTTVTATASKGEGDIKAVSDEGTHTLTAHEVTKADIIKKPTDHLTGTDLYSATGVTGVIENGVTKTYQKAGITSVTSDGQLPELEADKEKQVPVVITYNDGSREKTNVTLKVAPAAPNVTVNKQDGTTGDVTLTIKRHDDTNYPDGSVVTVPGIDETFKVKDGTITIKNDQLKDTVQTGKVTVKEVTKLPAETSDDKQLPAKKVSSVVPKFGTPSRDDSTGNVTISVTDQNGGALTNGTKVTLPGVKGDHTVQNGQVVISNDDLPDAEESGKGSIEEAGKFPSQSTDNVTVPAKKVSSKGNPAVDFIVKLPLPIVVPDSDHLTPQEIEKLVDEVKKSNPNTIVTADDKGNVTVTDQATGESVLIPVKDLTVPDFEPVTPTDKVPVKDLNNLSKDEQDKVKENVKKANPGKDVIVASDGNVTITNPETNVTHNIPRDELLFAYAKGEPEVLENPEFNGGVNGPDSPIHEVPEFNGGVNGEPETQPEVPDFTGGVNAPDSPIYETPEFNGGVNGEPETQEELPEFNGGVNTPDSPIRELPEFNGGVNGELPDPAELPKVKLLITKWIDENGNELKPADAKAPTVLGEANEAFEHGEIEGYVFVRTETEGDVVTHIFRKVSPVRPTGDGQQRPATPSDDTNPRPDTATPAEVPATQPTEQPSQTVEVLAQLPNEVSETDPSVSQPQAVLPNTGMKADRATGAFGVLSLLGAFGLLFAKKKKDDEEEA